MLFNSFEFIFLFLPISLALFYVLGRSNKNFGLYSIIIVSTFFYAYWRPINTLLIGPSILINYVIVRLLLRFDERRPKASSALFWTGIVFNLCFLGYFKYRDFGMQISNDVFGTSFVFDKLILPLGISFITFQKIGLLVDVRAGRVSKVNLREYLLFVLFFPQLIAGPIVHFREVMPQFEKLRVKLTSENVVVGLALFFSGLFKKVLLADPLSNLIAPIWHGAATGAHPPLIQAWAAGLGYMIRLYFDFSGYSDMAIGAARLFGIVLPYNFDSPLKAASVIDYWSRWHVTLTRFLTAYIFSPLSLALTRKRIAKKLPVVAGHKTTFPAFIQLMAYPTMVTMMLSGLWHGAGYQFLVFGGLHGVALVINHAWRLRKPAWWPTAGGLGRMTLFGSWLVTFLFVVCVEVFFYAPSVGVAVNILAGMAGQHGLTLPLAEAHRVAPVLAKVGVHVGPAFESGTAFIQVWALILLGLVVMLGLPNNYELMAAHNPALGFKPRPNARRGWLSGLTWRPSAGWAIGSGALAAFGILTLGQLSDFLYWHF